MHIRHSRTSFILAATLILSGCFSTNLDQQIAKKFFETQDYYYLSPSNTALSSTRLFSKRTSEAVEVWNLIDKKGFPDAMAVRSLDPFTLSLAYKKSKQTYLCTEGAAGWVITGPEKLDKKIKLPDNAKDDAPYSKTMHRAENTKEVSVHASANGSAPVIHHTEATRPQSLSLNEFKKLKSLVAKLGTEPAVMTANGDVAHTATSSGETISNIALWYTFDPNSANVISRINQTKGRTLVEGETITIPSYLIRNTLKYNPEFQKAYSGH